MDVAKEHESLVRIATGRPRIAFETICALPQRKAFDAGLVKSSRTITATDGRHGAPCMQPGTTTEDASSNGGSAPSPNSSIPATLGVVGDAYESLGDSASSPNEYFHTLEIAVTAAARRRITARGACILLDHNLRVDEVLAKAQEELKDRKDIYGYDIRCVGVAQIGS